MDLYGFAQQVRPALSGVTPALRMYEFGADKVEPPAAVFAWPESIDYHQAYGLGASKMTDAGLIVLVRNNVRRSAWKTLAGYVKPTGQGSVKAALEGFAWTTADTVTVTRVDFDTISMGGVELLAALFHLDIFGSGS